MPRKSPYDDTDHYTHETNLIGNEFHKVIAPLFTKYVEQGFSIRQLSHLVMNEVFECELLAMLDLNKAIREGRSAPPQEPTPGQPKLPLPRPKRAKDVQGDNPPKGIKS